MSPEEVLLRQYAATRDANAFAAIVRAHSRLVYGTCLRVTGNRADAEEAAQDCFFALARYADRIQTSLVGWLHATARNAALAKAKRAQRRRETEAAARTVAAARIEPTWESVEPYVDAAISDLPDELRLPLILHYLDGKPQTEVATALGIGQSTVSRRLARGVAELRGSLRKAGVAVSAAALASLMASHAASAAAPAALAASLGKMAVAGAGSGASAGTATSATTAAGTAGATATAGTAAAAAATGGIGIMKLSLIGLAAASVVTVGIVGLNSRAEQRPVSNAVPIVHAKPAAPADETKAVWDESAGVRVRHHVDVQAWLVILTKDAAEELGLGDLSTVRILTAEQSEGIVSGVKNRKDAREIFAPHVLTSCGLEALAEVTENKSYVSGYKTAAARAEPQMDSYEVAATRLSATPETDGKEVSFVHLAVRSEKNTLVPCEIRGVQDGKKFTANVSEKVTDTLLAQLDDRTAADVRLKHGEGLLIPATLSRAKPAVRIAYPDPVQMKRGDDPPPMLDEDETAFALVTATLISIEEVAPNDATPAGPPGDVQSDEKVFHQYDVTDIIVSRHGHSSEDAFVRVVAQATGPWNWDWVGVVRNEGIPGGSPTSAQGMLALRNGYLIVQQTPALHNAVSGILGELRKSVGRSFRRSSNPCTLFGKVVSAETGLPVEQADVFVFYPKTYEGFFLTTAEDGSFEFDHIPAGKYLLMAAAPGFAVFPHERTGADRNTLVPIEMTVEEPREEFVFELQPLPLEAPEE